MSGPPTVHVVDDDFEMRESLRLMLSVAGLGVETYDSAEDFLHRFVSADTSGPTCLIVDMRLPGLSGQGLHQKLVEDGIEIPTIVLTAYADVSVAVTAIKSGAVDFLEKPVHRHMLLECVQNALDEHAQMRLSQQRERALKGKLALLSKREKQVMELLLDAKNTKEIAAALQISQQTVAKHRAAILDKLEVNSVPALFRLDAASHSVSPRMPVASLQPQSVLQ